MITYIDAGCNDKEYNNLNLMSGVRPESCPIGGCDNCDVPYCPYAGG